MVILIHGVDESEYLLVDRANETKYHFVLAEALARAKKGKVLDGLTFYVTQEMDVPKVVITNIIRAGGGTVSTSHSIRTMLDLLTPSY